MRSVQLGPYKAADFSHFPYAARTLASLANRTAAAARDAVSRPFNFVEDLEKSWNATHRHPFAFHRDHERVVALPKESSLRRQRHRTFFPIDEDLRNTLGERFCDDAARYTRNPEEVAKGFAFARGLVLRRSTYVTAVDGSALLAGMVLRGEGHEDASQPEYFLFAPTQEIPRIMDVVYYNLRIARDFPDTPRYIPYRIKHFAKALFAYYQASPYDLASYSAGQALFAGFFHTIFGRKLRLTLREAQWMEFVSYSETAFIEEVSPYLSESLR